MIVSQKVKIIEVSYANWYKLN